MKKNQVIEVARARRHDLSSAMIDLETAAQAPVGSGAWCETMHLALLRLGSAFDAHVLVAEEEGGIIGLVVEDVPRLSSAGERLRVEHRSIRYGVDAVTTDVQAVGTPTSVRETDAVRDSVLQLFVDLSRHRRHGSDFIWEAYDVDIGGGS